MPSLGTLARCGCRRSTSSSTRKLEVLNFAASNVISRASFPERAPIQSRVLPQFDRTLASIMRWN
jgi:hypothetical protein